MPQTPNREPTRKRLENNIRIQNTNIGRYEEIKIGVSESQDIESGNERMSTKAVNKTRLRERLIEGKGPREERNR